MIQLNQFQPAQCMLAVIVIKIGEFLGIILGDWFLLSLAWFLSRLAFGSQNDNNSTRR